MATSWSEAAANAVLDAVCRNTSYAVAAVYVQLHTGNPGAAGTSNVATETTRKQATFGDAADSGTISNTVALTWTNVAGSEDFTNFSAWTLATGGSFLFSGTITANAVTAGDTFSIGVGDLDASLVVAS